MENHFLGLTHTHTHKKVEVSSKNLINRQSSDCHGYFFLEKETNFPWGGLRQDDKLNTKLFFF